MELIRIETTIMHQNVYIYFDASTKKGIIIDPGSDAKKIIKYIEDNEIEIQAILLTHGHFDHIGAVEKIKEHTGAIAYSHVLEKEVCENPELNLSTSVRIRDLQANIDKTFEDEDEYMVGDTSLKIIHISGHTVGGICYYDEKNKKIFTGDSLFKEAIGRSDLPGGNMDSLISDIKDKIFILPDDIEVLPGHGEASSIKHEKKFNPFFN